MKCPLFINELFIQGQLKEIRRADCLKEECAWYSDTEKTCSMLIIAANVAGLVAIGDELLKKMPHEEQFRT